MKVRKRILIPASAAAILLILLAALYFLALYFTDSDWVRTRVAREFTRAVGGTVHIEKISGSVFPRLCVTAQGIKYENPRVGSGSAKSIVLCPEIIPLFRGEVRIASAEVDEPDFISARPAREEPGFSAETVRRKVIPALLTISVNAPSLELKVSNGSLRVTRADGKILAFRGVGIDAGFSGKELRLKLENTVSPWGEISARGRFPFREDRLDVKDFSARVGDAAIKGAESTLEWEDDIPVVALDLESAGFDLGKLREWGLLARISAGPLGGIRELGGRLNLQSVQVKGPLERPAEWQLSLSGDLDGLTVKAAGAPQPVKVDTGRFSMDSDPSGSPARTFKIIGVKGSVGQSSFADVSGTLKQGRGAMRFQAEGRKIVIALAEALQWNSLKQLQKDRLGQVTSLDGTVVLDRAGLEGPVTSPAQWTYSFSGKLEGLRTALAEAPYPLRVSRGGFRGSGSPAGHRLEFSNTDGDFGKSSFSGVAGTIEASGGNPARIGVGAGRTSLDLEELYAWDFLKSRFGPVTALSGSLLLDSFKFAGSPGDALKWRYTASGTANDIGIETLEYPRAGLSGRFTLTEKSVALEQAAASLLDTNVNLTGSAQIPDRGIADAGFSVSGTLGQATLQWASKYRPLPPYMKVPASIQVTNARAEWKKQGPFSVKGNFIYPEGSRVALDLARNPNEWDIRELAVKDSRSDARLSLKIREAGTDFTFSGTLHKTTLDSFVVNEIAENAFVSGKISGHVPMKDYLLASVRGTISGGNIPVTIRQSAYPLIIRDITVQAEPDYYQIEKAGISWGDTNFSLSGSVAKKEKGLEVGLNVLTDEIVYEKLMLMIAEMQKAGPEKKEGPSAFWDLPVRGSIKVASNRFLISRYEAKPFSADIILGPRLVRLNFTNDYICGMPLPGTIDITPAGTSMRFSSTVRNVDLAPVLACLQAQKSQVTGKFDFTGELIAPGKVPDSFTGKFELTASRGRIYRFSIIGKILEYLNVTQILVGRVPRVGAEGLPFRTFVIKGHFEGSRVVIDEAEMSGSTLGLAGQGFWDLASNRIELTLLVSPLRTVDYVISKIPIVKYFFKGIVAIPISVYGDPASPTIVPLSPSAIGSQLQNILSRILLAPVRLLESFE